jgi:hypothetical protein
MAAASFDDFCIQVSERLNIEQPPVAAAHGHDRAFTLVYRGAEFNFIERARPEGDSVSMVVKFGVPPQERLAEVLSALMGAAFFMMGEGGAAFVRSPQTGEIFFHRLVAMPQLHPAGVQDFLDLFSGEVACWSEDYFLGDGAQAASDAGLFANRV